MDPIDIGLIVSGFLVFMVIIGVRVGFAAAAAGLVGLIWIFWAKKGYDPEAFTWALGVAVKTAGQVPHSKVASQALSLIPTFILIGFLAYHAGLTRALFEAAKRWVAWLPGGLGVATVFATAGFAAVSGASVATSAVFARIAIPEMLKIGYDKRFAAGVVASAGTLASLIPPSAILVIYAIIVEQDVGALLLAGFLPGAFSRPHLRWPGGDPGPHLQELRPAGRRLHLGRAFQGPARRLPYHLRGGDHYLLYLQPPGR